MLPFKPPFYFVIVKSKVLMDYQNKKIVFFPGQSFPISTINQPPFLVRAICRTKWGPIRFSCFKVFFKLQTEKQTEKQYLYTAKKFSKYKKISYNLVSVYLVSCGKVLKLTNFHICWIYYLNVWIHFVSFTFFSDFSPQGCHNVNMSPPPSRGERGKTVSGAHYRIYIFKSAR